MSSSTSFWANLIKRVRIIYKFQTFTDTQRNDSDTNKNEEGGVLQRLSFISGSEIQLHIFTTGPRDLQD